MRRDNETRVYGPYQHGEVWRNHNVVRRSDGTRKTFYDVYPTRELAEDALSGSRFQAQGDSVKSAVDALLEQMRKDGLAASTIETNEYRLGHFFQLPKYGSKPIRWLAKRGDDLYEAAQKDRSADTHQAELALAKQLGALCVKKRWLRENPFAAIEPAGRKNHGATKARLRVDESRKLVSFCLERTGDQHATVTLAYLLLGARASELTVRSVRDLDDGGRLLWIDKAKTPTGRRKVEIPEVLAEQLRVLVDGKAPTDPIFTMEDGQRATRRWANYHVKRICGEAKVPVLPPQALRRTHSDLATDAGVSGVVIAAHLGQTSTAVTDRSYRSKDVVAAAKQGRTLMVLAGGRP